MYQLLCPCREELITLKRELDLKSTQLIWECKKLSESEAKLHKSEKDKARMVNDACKMKLKLQEALDNQGNGIQILTCICTTCTCTCM